MADLVEEATIFQLTSVNEQWKWETVLTHRGRLHKRRVWVTRPVKNVSYDASSDSETSDHDANAPNDGPDNDRHTPPATIFVNQYENDSALDEDMDVDLPYCPELDLAAALLANPNHNWDPMHRSEERESGHLLDSDEPGSDSDLGETACACTSLFFAMPSPPPPRIS